MNIISVPGRLVRDPVTQRIVDGEGLTIDPTDLYWARLLRDGDVVEAPSNATAPAAEDVVEAPSTATTPATPTAKD